MTIAEQDSREVPVQDDPDPRGDDQNDPAAAGLDSGERPAVEDQQQPGAGSRASGWLLVLPLVLVTTFAVYGQIGAGYDAFSPSVPADKPTLKWVVAIGASMALESIALYVQYQAHSMFMMGATAAAARHRRASYAIAFGVAAINYQHFAGEAWAPTPAAVVFAGFSAAGPWLWGLHSRHMKHVQLRAENKVDDTGAVFSIERWRSFPVRTWRARRTSIDLGITDPRAAWEAERRLAAQRKRRTNDEQQLAAQRKRKTSDEQQPADDLDVIDPVDLDPADEDDAEDEQRPGDEYQDPDRDDDEPVVESVERRQRRAEYQDPTRPLGDRIDLAIAAELADDEGVPGQRRLAQMLGARVDDTGQLVAVTRAAVRGELDRRARLNGHNPHNRQETHS